MTRINVDKRKGEESKRNDKNKRGQKEVRRIKT